MSWSLASLSFVKASDKLEIEVAERTQQLAEPPLTRPPLPSFLNDLEVANLRVGAAVLDLHMTLTELRSASSFCGVNGT